LARKPWRWIVFGLVSLAGLMGGFRYFAGRPGLGLYHPVFLEGMHRTKLLPIFGMLGIAATLLIIPLAPSLPLTAQRALAFLPLPIDPRCGEGRKRKLGLAHQNVGGRILPQIPKYLLLGKGYGFSADDYQFMGRIPPFTPLIPSRGAWGCPTIITMAGFPCSCSLAFGG
jgi:hypothetical protein